MSDPDDDAPISSKLATALEAIGQRYGGDALHLGSDEEIQVTALSTGNQFIDEAFGVPGFPRGRISEIFGEESCGKTTLALSTLAEAQRRDGVAAFIDVEHAFNPEQARGIGLNLDKLLVSQPQSAEEAIDTLIQLVRSEAIDAIVLDSIAALATERQRIDSQSKEKDAHLAIALLLSEKLKIVATDIAKTNTTLIVTNQTRMREAGFGNMTEETPGGKALKFHASLRVKLEKKDTMMDSDGTHVGSRIHIRVEKNKVAPPYGEAKVDLIYGEGFPEEPSLFDCAVKRGFISRKGNYYYLNYYSNPEAEIISFDPDNTGGGELSQAKLGHGRLQSIAALKEIPGAFVAFKQLVLSIRKSTSDGANG